MNAPQRSSPDEVIAFWTEAGPERWFKKDAEFDRRIVDRFRAAHAAAAAGQLDHWEGTPRGALALLLLLDQFSRNMFRGTPETFAQDEKARAIATRAIGAGFDRMVPPELRNFFYLPFQHSESILDQERAVRYSQPLGGEALLYARLHYDIIRRFGRFPHRNAVLGRHTTPAEQDFLAGGGFAG